MTALALALRTALLDFIWQGLFVSFLLWVALLILRHRPARIRYAACCAALLTMTVLPVITTAFSYLAGPVAALSSNASLPALQRAATVPRAANFDWSLWFNQWALPVWSAGVLLLSLRLAWASRRVSNLRRASHPADDAILSRVAQLAARMALTRPVRVLMTAAADCPSVVGSLRPVILLPAATLAGLTPQQLEAVLAHELAHILRYDHLVNTLQSAVETLLFYHPAVWWVSSRIRHERELCCDDLAVSVCGDALCYARALTALERLRVVGPGLPALALGSTGGPLLYRIRRIMGETRDAHVPSKLPGVLALSLGLIGLACNLQWARAQQPAERGIKVDTGGAQIIHRPAVRHPGSPAGQAFRGEVILEVTVASDGSVGDARVLSGPAELRKTSLQSVLDWHFAPEFAGTTRQVTISFDGTVVPDQAQKFEAEAKAREEAGANPELAEAKEQLDKTTAELGAHMSLMKIQRDVAGAKIAGAFPQDEASQLQWKQQAEQLERSLQQLRSQENALAGNSSDQQQKQAAEIAELQARMQAFPDAAMTGYRVKSIAVEGLSETATAELLARLPIHAGDTLAPDSLFRIQDAAAQFDTHLVVAMTANASREVEIRITASGANN